MISILEVSFWLSLTLLVYPYVVYPWLMRVLARAFPYRQATPVPASERPCVTLIISAYNEAEVLPAKLDNALALDYPADRFEIIVVSDASSDGTDDIARAKGAHDVRVRLVRQVERRGKSAGLNRGVAAAGGDIVVFSDANAMYRGDAIRELVVPFADPQVGYVVGAALYNAPEGGAAESESLYWDQELKLKALESQFDSVVGGDGAIYAIRRHLFWDLRDDDISDFVNPLQIIAAGYRGVFNPRAVCYENAGDTYEKEFRRKRRIVNRTWRAVCCYARGARLRGRYRFMLCSHKVVRWFGLVTLGAALLANLGIVLLAPFPIYVLTLAGLCATLLLSGTGMVLTRAGRRLPRPIYLCYFFIFANVAALLGILDEARGIRHATWDHVRQRGG